MPSEANLNKMAHMGRTILDMLDEQADYKFADLMDLVNDEKNWDAEAVEAKLIAIIDGEEPDCEELAEEIVKSSELRGLLRGMAFCLAFLRNPDPETVDVQAQKDAMVERYEAEQGD